MWILIIGLIVLTAIAMAVGYARNKKIQKKIESGELQAAPEIVEADAECCGQHEICEKESLLAAVSKKVEYYDDEELDRFRGHSSGYRIAERIERRTVPDSRRTEIQIIPFPSESPRQKKLINKPKWIY